MKNLKTIFIVSLATITLSACTIKKPPQNLDIQATGGFEPGSVSIAIESSLSKNAKLDIIIKDDDSKKTIYETTLKTDEKGRANKKISLDVGNKKLTGILLFKPEDQPKAIQDKFGHYGQNIRSNALGYTVGKLHNEKYMYIKQYGSFLKFGAINDAGNLIFLNKKLKLDKEGNIVHN